MARLTEQQWLEVREGYEIDCLSYTALSKKFGVDKSNISRKAKAEAWCQDKAQQLLRKKVNNFKELKEIEAETQQYPQHYQRALRNKEQYLLEMEGLFEDGLKESTVMTMKTVRSKYESGEIGLTELNAYSQILQRNKESVFGKSPDTAIQVNNNESPKTVKVEFIGEV